jgi:Ricin-type beta-trefoil lectin domain-like
VSFSSEPGESADAHDLDRPFRPPDGYPRDIVVPPPPDFGPREAPDGVRPYVVVPPPPEFRPAEAPGAVRDDVSAPPDAARADVRDVAVWPPEDARPDSADGAMPGGPPHRPARPVVVAAVAIGGAVLLAIPLLLVGPGSHDEKKHRSASAAGTVPSGDAQPPPPPPSFPASPTPVPTPSLSLLKKTTKATPKSDGKDATAEQAAATNRDDFRGAADVLLKNAGGGRCADVPGYESGFPGLFLQTGYCTYGGSDNQVWSLGVVEGVHGPGGAALFVIRNTMDGYCVDLPGHGAQASGTDVGEQSCQPSKNDNDLWYRTHVRGDLYRIRNYASHGLCFGVAGRSTAVEKRLEIHACRSADAWSWPNGE